MTSHCAGVMREILVEAGHPSQHLTPKRLRTIFVTGTRASRQLTPVQEEACAHLMGHSTRQWNEVRDACEPAECYAFPYVTSDEDVDDLLVGAYTFHANFDAA